MGQALKSYDPPWEGRLLLACKKCQKKLKKSGEHAALANLKKTLKARNKLVPDAQLHVLNIGCMDVCPKHAVAACMNVNGEDRLFILRSEEELGGLSG